jgi:hypothetical protein
MTVLGVIRASLFYSSVALFVFLQPLVYHQIHRHLHRHHRKAFDRFRISPSASFICSFFLTTIPLWTVRLRLWQLNGSSPRGTTGR